MSTSGAGDNKDAPMGPSLDELLRQAEERWRAAAEYGAEDEEMGDEDEMGDEWDESDDSSVMPTQNLSGPVWAWLMLRYMHEYMPLHKQRVGGTWPDDGFGFALHVDGGHASSAFDIERLVSSLCGYLKYLLPLHKSQEEYDATFDARVLSSIAKAIIGFTDSVCQVACGDDTMKYCFLSELVIEDEERGVRSQVKRCRDELITEHNMAYVCSLDNRIMTWPHVAVFCINEVQEQRQLARIVAAQEKMLEDYKWDLSVQNVRKACLKWMAEHSSCPFCPLHASFNGAAGTHLDNTHPEVFTALAAGAPLPQDSISTALRYEKQPELGTDLLRFLLHSETAKPCTQSAWAQRAASSSSRQS